MAQGAAKSHVADISQVTRSSMDGCPVALPLKPLGGPSIGFRPLERSRCSHIPPVQRNAGQGCRSRQTPPRSHRSIVRCESPRSRLSGVHTNSYTAYTEMRARWAPDFSELQDPWGVTLKRHRQAADRSPLAKTRWFLAIRPVLQAIRRRCR